MEKFNALKKAQRPVVLLTDFGPQSPYVGQMKLVLAARANGSDIIDLAHDLPPQNIEAASLVLCGSWDYVPDGAVLVGVIDPGVGSKRKILAAVFSRKRIVIVPDNGLLSQLAAWEPPKKVYAIENENYFLPNTSAVFHGRDIFAPVAAYVANGGQLKKLGPRISVDQCVQIHTIQPSYAHHRWLNVRIIYADPFGNLITNLHSRLVKDHEVKTICCQSKKVPFVRTYADVAVGKPLALMGSYQYLELAVRNASAAKFFNATVGQQIEVESNGQS